MRVRTISMKRYSQYSCDVDNLRGQQVDNSIVKMRERWEDHLN